MSTCKEVQSQLRGYLGEIRSSDPEVCRYTLFPKIEGFEEVATHLEGCRTCQEVFGNIKEREQREDQELCSRCGKPRSAHLRSLATYVQYKGGACSNFQAQTRNWYEFRPVRENDK